MHKFIASRLRWVLLGVLVLGLLVPVAFAVTGGSIVGFNEVGGCSFDVLVDVTAQRGRDTRGLDTFSIQTWDDGVLIAEATWTVPPNGRSSSRAARISIDTEPGQIASGLGIVLRDHNGAWLDIVDPYNGVDYCNEDENQPGWAPGRPGRANPPTNGPGGNVGR